MAGEYILEQMQSKGGTESEYSDFVYGTVVSTEPLKIQIGNKLPLTSDFLILGRHVTKHVEKERYLDRTDSGDGYRDADVYIDESLHVGDKVLMIRGNGGQHFYVLEHLVDGAAVDRNE